MRHHRGAFVLILAATLAMPGGCPSAVEFAESLDVAISATQLEPAAPDTGPPLLENSTWALYRKADASDAQITPAAPGASPYGAILDGVHILPRLAPDVLMARVSFGPGGRGLRLFDNAFYVPELLGTEFVLDAQPHPTATPLLTYVVESYGLSIGERFGFATPITVSLAGSPIGNGMAYAWGTRSGDRIDGQFGYAVEVSLPNTLFGDGVADQYPFYALRE